MNGIYEIIDITYDFDERGRDVTLKCSLCGREIHRMMIRRRNKWSQLIKSCPCEKERVEREYQERLQREKEEKQKLILGRLNQAFGDYKITSVIDLKSNNPRYILRCCECGDEMNVSANSFWQRANFECKKHRPTAESIIKFDESYIGRKKNFLKVIGISRFPKNNHRAFICECDCGDIKLIEPAHWEQGIVKSCGCKTSELHSQNSIIHGHSGDRLYRVWNSMKQRCYNKNNSNYENYGGRGIRICKEWLDDFANFYNWAMANGYDYNAEFGECTIDRIDVNGNYEPSNCRWVDAVTQANNKRPRKDWKPRKEKVEFRGKKYRFNELCKMFGTSDPAVRYRMNKLGMTLEQALTTPKMTEGRPRK